MTNAVARFSKKIETFLFFVLGRGESWRARHRERSRFERFARLVMLVESPFPLRLWQPKTTVRLAGQRGVHGPAVRIATPEAVPLPARRGFLGQQTNWYPGIVGQPLNGVPRRKSE